MRDKLLICLLPARSFAFLLIFIVASFITHKPLAELSNIWSVIADIINILGICVLFLVSRSRGGFAKLIGYEKGTTKFKTVIGMVLLIFFAGLGGMNLAGLICYGVIPYAAPMMIAPIALPLAVINLFILPVSTAIAEEGLYLGCGVNQIKNKYLAIVVPAFFFALQHCFIPTLFDMKFILYRFISFFPLTVILCVIYYRRRNPVPIMIGHAVIDLATAVQIFVTSAIPGLYEKMISWQ